MNKTLINSITRNDDKNILKNISLILGAIIFLILMSQVKIALPFTPVPITGQTFAVILIGLTYTRKQSILVLLGYVILAAIGLPVFAGWKSGLIFNIATGGYILGFFVAVELLGYVAEKGLTKSYGSLIFVIIISNIIIYTLGIFQLSLFLKDKTLIELLQIGAIPFIPGDIFKMALAVLLLPNMWKFVK